MLFDIGDRQTGKTEGFIWWLRHNPDAIGIVHHQNEAIRLRLDYGVKNKLVSAYSARDGKGLRGIRAPLAVAIDNLDLVLPTLLEIPTNTPIEYVTATGRFVDRER